LSRNEGIRDETTGRKKMKPTAAAAAGSGFFATMPAQAPTHVIAKAVNGHRPKASSALPNPLWILQPTAKPVLTRTRIARAVREPGGT
jgi:hypothetical protein